ncbi:MAG: hypothetical protein ACOZAO_01740 [Patescibacteria group bacterium]
MLSELTERQIVLLQAIINEYLESSNPVGSGTIVKKYGIKYSAATVRNDMAELLKKGLLEMIHTSSGRIPSTLAYRIFLDDLMEEEELPVLQEVAIKQRLWASRFQLDRLLRQSALALSDLTKEAAFATTDDGYLVHAGTVNLLDYQEFWDISVTKSALFLLDRYELLEKILNSVPAPQDVACLIGDELASNDLTSCSILFSRFRLDSTSGYIGVLGPARMQYASVVPSIRYTKSLIQELAGSW